MTKKAKMNNEGVTSRVSIEISATWGLCVVYLLHDISRDNFPRFSYVVSRTPQGSQSLGDDLNDDSQTEPGELSWFAKKRYRASSKI